MTRLQVVCLDGFQVTLAEKPLNVFQTDKMRALLVYLAIEDRVHARSELAQFLWPGYGQESARNSLRQSLYQLRHLLLDSEAEAESGEAGHIPFLLLTRQTVQINPVAPIQVDVLTFRQLLAACSAHNHADIAACPACLARLRQAVDLYHRDFLLDLTIADSDPFEEWRRITQELLHIQALDALMQLANAAERAGDEDAALQAAQRQVDLEPWLESAHRQIMRILAKRGQRAAAIAQYQRCRQVLAEELQVEPDAETCALYEQIRQAHPAELPSRPEKTLNVAYYVLPEPRTSLVGRRDELAALQTLFPHTRLVTLTGPSGSGKTRLAIATAAALTAKFADGICMVELAELTNPALLPQVVAGALGQTAQPDLAGQHQLMGFLRDKQLLLVLDSCERLDKVAATWINRWLDACAQLCILATSHGALNVAGEQLWPLSPLAYPPATLDLALDLSLEQLATFEAVQLFVARVQEVKADFALTAANSSAIAQICQRLGGIPLALELAAARVKLLTPAEIAARLNHRIDAAIASNPGAPARHQTLAAALAWSFDALDADEQILFQQLALFVGGFDLSAVETVADLPDTLNVLSHLIDRSLVTTEMLGDQTRYRMLAVIREYAYDKLAHSGEVERMRQRHANYFLQLAECTQLDPQADGEALWLQPETDNFSSALAWMLTHKQPSPAVRLAGALTWYWWMRSYLHSARGPLQAALADLEEMAGGANDTEDAQSSRASLLFAAGTLFALWDEAAQAEQALVRALALAEAAHNQPLAGLAVRVLTGVAVRQKAYDAANHWIAYGLSIWQKLGGSWHIAWLYAHQGDMAWEQGDQTGAWRAYEASTKLPVNPGARAYPFRRMAYLALGRGDTAEALALCRESLQLNLASGDRQGIAACLVGVARMRFQHAQALPATTRGPLLHRAAQLLGAVETLLNTVEGRLLQADETVYQQTSLLLRGQMDDISPTAYAAALAEGRALAAGQAIALALQQEELAAQEDTLPPDEELAGPAHTDEVAAPPIDTHPADNTHQDTASPSSDPVSPTAEMLPLALSQLPEPLTPLIGRQQELNELLTRLQEPGVRLITLVGAGGMGKTRLALAVGRTIAEGGIRNAEATPDARRTPTYTDGVFFVPLASLTTADALVSTIATVLGITVGTDPQQTLRQFLRDKQLLLILDNFEHILPGASAVADLLQHAPGVQILTTSRERLNIRGEQLYPVPPLHFAAQATLAEATDSSAVRLFVQSAQQAQANFQLDPTNLAAVLRICQLVQGMPLGLELAAANIGVLPLHVIVDEIEHSATFLAADWQDAPERQRSMRAVFAWSWQLLNPTEQRALRQLAVFRSGFDRVAAQAVTGVTLPILARLIQKSLLQWHERAGNEGRYTMHELLRQFAAEELEGAQDEAEMVSTRHSIYYLTFVGDRETRLTRHESRQAADEIQIEINNVRQAWTWAATHQATDDVMLSNALDHAAYTLWEFYELRGPRIEAVQMLHLALQHAALAAVDAAGEPSSHLHRQGTVSKWLALQARALVLQGKHGEAAVTARQAIRLGQVHNSMEGETLGLLSLAFALFYMNQPGEARTLFEQMLQLAQCYRDQVAIRDDLVDAERIAYEYLASIALGAGDYPSSRAYILHALQLCRQLGKQGGEQLCLYRLARLAYLHGDYPTAVQEFQQSLALVRTLGHQMREAYILTGLGHTLQLQGDYRSALAALEQGLNLSLRLEEVYVQVIGLSDLMQLHCLLGNATAATTLSMQLLQLLEKREVFAECRWAALNALAYYAQFVGEPHQALAYAEQAWQMRQEFTGYGPVQALITLGNMLAGVQRWSEAAEAYEAAIAGCTKIVTRKASAEPHTGLARIALAQGDLADAQAHVEVVLSILAEAPHAGYNDPFVIYLTCYQILIATGDPRAIFLLQQGYDLLQQAAAALDAESRPCFLEAVPSHRALVTAYHEQA